MNLSIVVTICVFILGVTFGLMKIIYDIIMKRVEALEQKMNKQSLEINTLKNFNSMVVDRIEKDINALKDAVNELKKTISDKIHRDSDIINQQKNVIERVSRILDNNELLQGR